MTINWRWGCVYDAAPVILLVAIMWACLLHRRRMCPIIATIVLGPLGRSLSSISCHLRDSRIWRAGHWRPSHSGDILMLMNSRFGVHSFLGTDMSQCWIGCRTSEARGRWMGARVIADKVEVIARGSCYAEGLLHQAIWLVAIPIWSIFSTHIHI